MIHVETDKVDALWKTIASSIIEEGKLGAKLSPRPSDRMKSHVICVYTNDYLNEEEVHDAERKLREAGVVERIYYKPDLYSHLNLYSNNKWRLKVSVYVSDYNAARKKSKISCHVNDRKYSENKKPEESNFNFPYPDKKSRNSFPVITFDPSKEDFNSWILRNSPSKIPKDDASWIAVWANKLDENEESVRVKKAEEAWEELQTSNYEWIFHQDLQYIAEDCGIKCGKWLIHISSDKVDALWMTVASAVVREGSFGAKVSTRSGNGSKSHVICVYNSDYTKEEEVCSVERKLRAAGITGRLCYKPELYSHLNIYYNNPWDLKVSVYVSEYDEEKKTSKVKSNMNERRKKKWRKYY